MKEKQLLFINTFEPVVPLYHDVFAHLKKEGVEPLAIISTCQYRGDEVVQDHPGRKLIWVPNLFRAQRRWCAAFYYFLVPFLLLTVSPQCRIVFLSQPPLLYIIGASIARWRGIPYYLHVMDLYPELLMRLGLFSSRWLSGRLKRASMRAFAGAEQVITPGRCMEAVLRNKGVPAEKLTVIENWPEKELRPDRVAGEKFRETHGLKDKLVVMYSGNMGQFHNFDTILAVARRLQSRSDVVFIFIGQGFRHFEVQRAIDHGMDNIILLGYQPAKDFVAVLNAGDVHFVSLREGFEGLMVPSKFYGILAVGRPVVYEGNSTGEVARVIAEEDCGVVIEPGDVQSLEKTLLGYLDGGERCLQQGVRARKAYETRFYADSQCRRYVQVISD